MEAGSLPMAGAGLTDLMVEGRGEQTAKPYAGQRGAERQERAQALGRAGKSEAGLRPLQQPGPRNGFLLSLVDHMSVSITILVLLPGQCYSSWTLK